MVLILFIFVQNFQTAYFMNGPSSVCKNHRTYVAAVVRWNNYSIRQPSDVTAKNGSALQGDPDEIREGQLWGLISPVCGELLRSGKKECIFIAEDYYILENFIKFSYGEPFL